MNNPDVKIAVAAHKMYRMPEDGMYIPLLVGAVRHEDKDEFVSAGWMTDDTGIEISAKNPGYCELTGLYWAWKNLKAEYIGLCHYRRYFSASKKSDEDSFKNILTGAEARMILTKYDLILPKKRNYYIETLYSHYAHTHDVTHLDATMEIIKEHCPEYEKDAIYVWSQKGGYMFNMCVMKRSLLAQYCEFLFPILEELEKKFETRAEGEDGAVTYTGRFYGRVAELLFNVWLVHMIRTKKIDTDDIYNLKCIYMEKIDRLRKGASFLAAKFLGRKYDKSF